MWYTLVMNTFTEKIVQGKMNQNTDELETSSRLSGNIFESITLGLGDTTLQRQVLPDGSRGEIKISTQENDDLLGSSTTYRKYVLIGGEIVPDAEYGERQVGSIRKAIVLAKIAFGRVNHWDAESEFHGTFSEEEE